MAERRCFDCGEPAAYYCSDCKQPVCEQEVEHCALFLHNWRELDDETAKN